MVKTEKVMDKDKFMSQVKRTIDIANIKYPADEHDAVWAFDQSSGHTALADDALNAKRPNLNPGGKQPCMRNTVYNGVHQKLVFDSGPHKEKNKNKNKNKQTKTKQNKKKNQ